MKLKLIWTLECTSFMVYAFGHFSNVIQQVYIEKKHPYDCFTNLSEDMTALWCAEFSNHG